MTIDYLFFDLDGTLTDSRPGIVASYRHAMAVLGREAPADAELTRYVGPPLGECLAVLLQTGDAALVERAIAAYRSRFERVGMFENALYPGVDEAIAALARSGRDLFVVTAKPAPYARRILEHFGIAGFFRRVHGPQLGDRRHTKATLVRALLASTGIAPDSAVMIGDRADDVVGARENGLGAVAVTWGYGCRDELEAAGADALVDSTAGLLDYIARAKGAGTRSTRVVDRGRET